MPGIIEPGHFRFTASGETVVRLEQRLGYTHKGIEGLMTRRRSSATPQNLPAASPGDSTVAYALCASREPSKPRCSFDVPARAVWLRALLAELERLANHLGDIGAICNDASFALMQAHCNVLREDVLRAADIAFGHRLMRDVIVPGGVARDLDERGKRRIRAALDNIQRPLSRADRTLRQHRLASGSHRRHRHRLARAGKAVCRAGGYVGRASGRAFDARRAPGYAPYYDLRFDVPVLDEGDVNARVWIRIREVEQSLSLAQPDSGPSARRRAAACRSPSEPGPREGMALVEGFRGDIMVWLRLDGGRIERCHLRDPSWFQWPLLEAAIEDNIVADFPLCNKSFNCSYSGQDL